MLATTAFRVDCGEFSVTVSALFVWRAFSTGTPPAPRYHHSAVMLDGSMFIFGKNLFFNFRSHYVHLHFTHATCVCTWPIKIWIYDISHLHLCVHSFKHALMHAQCTYTGNLLWFYKYRVISWFCYNKAELKLFPDVRHVAIPWVAVL